MPRRGQCHAPAALGPNGSIARGTRYGKAKRAALEAEVARMHAALYSVAPAELGALRLSGTLSEPTAFCADVAAAEIVRLRRAVEGEGPDGQAARPLSAQRVARLHRAQRILTLGLAFQARALQADDREAAATAGALLAKADALLVATLGLETEASVPDLRSYLASKAAASAPNGPDPEPEPARAEIAAQERSE